MIGLRRHRRDARLCERFGTLRAPSETEVVERVARHLVINGAPPTHAEWTYARWKPGTALTVAHEVTFADGSACTIVSKQHAGEKLDAPRPYDGLESALRAHAIVPELRATLSSFPHDRELPGLERCFDMRRLARHVDAHALFGTLRMRPGPSKVTTLRYKPERRAVLMLALRLRERDDAPRESAQLIVRVHPEDVAARIAETRRAFDAVATQGLAPRLLAADERGGVLFEEWFDVAAFEPDVFDHARTAGALLAQLHALPCTSVAHAERVEAFDEWRAIVPQFEGIESLWHDTPSHDASWIHGDFHPDQVAALRAGGYCLLDLDALVVGAPTSDLASWIADHVAATGVEWRDAARPLLDAYVDAGGAVPDERALARAVARALVRLAAGALRRLQWGATELARERLDLARSIASVRAPTQRADVRVDEQAVVERMELGKDAAVIVTESVGGVRRWCELRNGSRSVLSPSNDPALALASHLRELEGASRVDVLAYRPSRRLTVRCHGDDGTRVILKGYRRGRDVDMARNHRAATALTMGGTLRCAKLLEHDVEHCALVLEDLGGCTLELGTLDLRRLTHFGEDLVRFQHAASATPLREHEHADELRRIDELAARATTLGCARVAEWDATRQAIEAALRRLGAPALVNSHGDLHDGQLLELGDTLGLIDFDMLCRADEARDVGNFLAHLELRRLQGAEGLDPEYVAELRSALLRAIPRQTADFARRLSFYEGSAFARLSFVYALRPPWAHLSNALVQRSAELVQKVLV